MNKHIVATGCLLTIAAACSAEPVADSVKLENLIQSSDSVYLCQVQSITVSPSKVSVQKGVIGTYEIVCKVLASFKGGSLPQVKIGAEIFSNRANPVFSHLATNGVMIAFLRQSDTPDRFVWTQRWYSAMPIRKHYPAADSDEWNPLERILTQLDKATQSDDPEEVRCGLFWLNISKQTASQVSKERLWELASSENYDVRILALRGLAESGDSKAIEQSVKLAIKISKEKMKVDHENLWGLLWHIATRFPEKVPHELAQEMATSTDAILNRPGKEILEKR